MHQMRKKNNRSRKLANKTLHRGNTNICTIGNGGIIKNEKKQNRKIKKLTKMKINESKNVE